VAGRDLLEIGHRLGCTEVCGSKGVGLDFPRMRQGGRCLREAMVTRCLK
jgi:hypothetical protein